MRKILLMLFIPALCFGQTSNYKITRVIDGDTIEIEAPFLPAPLKPVLSIRIMGIDTPEKGHRAQCSEEGDLGNQATEFTKNAIAHANNINIIIIEPDKFFRVLGDIIVDGNSLGQLLIEHGFARQYHGNAKLSWCK